MSSSIDFAAFRRERNHATAKRVALVCAGFAIASCGQALYHQSYSDVLPHLPYVVALMGPAMLSRLGYAGNYIDHASVLGHLLISASKCAAGLGLLTVVKSVRRVYASQQELVPEFLLTVQTPGSLLVMGVLHAVRQCAAALMCTRCVGTPACYDWRRWVMNWVILMVVQYCYDLHTRYLYRKTLQRGAADVPARTGTDAIRASKLGGGSRGGAAGNSDKSCGTTDEACLVTSGGLGETQAQGTHAPTNAESWPGPPSQESTNAATPRRRDADINADIIALRSVAQVHGLEGLEAVHRNTVHVKLHGLSPEQLPPKFLAAVQIRLSTRMPDTHVAGAGLRRGCVIVCLDLVSRRALPGAEAGGQGVVSASDVVQVLAEALGDCDVETDLHQGAPATAQAGSELTSFSWDSSAYAYVRSESVGAQLVALMQLVALCRLVSAGPVVQCLPAAAGTRNQRVQLQLQLTVPSRSRLLGWQPAGSAVSAEAEALTLSSDVSQLDVLVLVRRQGGAYLPVTLSLLSDSQTPTAGSETWAVRVQAEVDVPCQDATGLSVEMWAKAPVSAQTASGSRPELLVAHSPVLLFTAQQQAAAAELLQLVQAMGGVSAIQDLQAQSQGTAGRAETHAVSLLLDDLGAWLSYMSDASAGNYANAHLEDDMPITACMGTGILTQCVRLGLSEVSQLVVSAMVQSSGTAQVVAEQGAPWFLAAAKPAAFADERSAVSSLLHAAMASGNPDTLGQVLRWGQMYGGHQWRWPWSLTDAGGFTALHHAAFQPQPSVCVALLETVKHMLPGQIPAAHAAWVHEQGAVGKTPAQLFLAVHPLHPPASLWEQHSTAKPAPGRQAQAVAAGPPSAGQANASRTAAESPSDAPTDSEPLPSFWCLMREAWRWRQPPEYEAWALRQLSTLVYTWAWALLFVFNVVVARLCMDHTLPAADLSILLMHQVVYGLITATSLGFTRLGTWQTWMFLMPFSHMFAYIYFSRLPASERAHWHTIGAQCSDVLYTVFIASVAEQNSLPYMAGTRLALAPLHGLALRTVGLSHPFLRTAVKHTLAVLVNTLARTYQLRSFHRWLRDSARKKDVSATAAPSPGRASMEGPDQHRGKVKVQYEVTPMRL